MLSKPLALHSVSFGGDSSAQSLRRMADIGQQVYAMAPRATTRAGGGTNNQPQCTFSTALDSVHLYLNCQRQPLIATFLQVKLTETFLGIAASLRKPRASLMRG